MNEKIIIENTIWDLHIHTCCCKKSSNEFNNMTIEEYINNLIDIFKNYKSLQLISFTDHNWISKEVYKKFIKRNTGINLLPGIEVDVYLNDVYKNKNDYKHIIIYFDEKYFDFDKHCDLINDKLLDSPILLYKLIDFLITNIKVPFLLSPHFMKQDSRGIDYDWDEEKTKKEIDKYIDQMICFWETSNLSNIQRAIDFLIDFDRDNKVSVISFSDSNNSKKLVDYLENPKQYFSALPTFEGVRMVGSDCRRIKFEKEILDENCKGLYIGKIKQGKNEITLSPKMNTVIGGRGSGKSLLIDGISLTLKKQLDDILLKERIDYLKQLKYEVYDMQGNNLIKHNFQIDYFNQGFIMNLFDDNAKLIENIYFANEFNKLENYDIEQTRNTIISDYKYKKCRKETLKDNISSILSTNIKISESKNELQLSKNDETKLIEYTDIEKIINDVFSSEIVPEVLRDNDIIKRKGLEYIQTILYEIKKYNDKKICDNISSKISNKYFENMNNKSEQRNKKNQLLENLKKKIKIEATDYINRVSLINQLLIMAQKCYSKDSEIKVNGYNNNYFVFKKELKVQNIMLYLYDIFNVYFDSFKCKHRIKCDKTDFNNLFKLINGFCFFPEDLIMESKNLSSLMSELRSLKGLKIDIINDVYYKEDEKELVNIRNLSPGTKANILMEYIVFKDTKVPLLIDQPEDNIDNKTIYNILTNWFVTLKNKRQVIVATHDANIVINGDSENVIICEQTKDNNFVYQYGALESDGVLKNISTILDGGNDAIKRRLLKYGE